MNHGFVLIDPPVDYWFDSVSEVEAWLETLKGYPASQQRDDEIHRVEEALSARVSEDNALAREWGLLNE